MLVAFLVAGIMPGVVSVVPVKLQCEYRDGPLGIDVAPPRLIWQVPSDERDHGQTAYQILVASSPELLEKNSGDLWDSAGSTPFSYCEKNI